MKNTLEAVQEKVLEACRSSVPKTPLEIAASLKKTLPGFYKATPADKIVARIKQAYLNSLVERGLLVEYSPDSSVWANARALIKYFREKEGKEPPRKLSSLYQINFLCIGGDPWFYKIPALANINLEMCSFLYPRVQKRKFVGFFANLVNLCWCYGTEYRERMRLELYATGLDDNEKERLEKALELSTEARYFYETLPFKPNPQAAIAFLNELCSA
jgi:hypothetical protein